MNAEVDIGAADSQAISRRMAGGVLWSYGGSVLVLIAQVAYTALTARILEPSAFGAYASANALISLLAYFSFPALGATLARMPDVSRTTVGTSLGIAAAAGTVAGLVSVLLAGIWATVWHTPDASRLIVLWAPAIALSALAYIPMGLLRRDHRFGSAARIETLAPLVGFVVGGALVLVLQSPSGLVLGQVANVATMFAVGLIAVRREVGLTFSRVEAHGLVSFSSQVSAQSLTQYGIYTFPALVIARGAGAAALGFFSRANFLVLLPSHLLSVGIVRVLYPVFAQVTDPDARRRALSDLVSIATYLIWPLLGILAGSAGLVVRLVFGPGWAPAAELISPLCLFAAANLIYVVLYSATESVGWLRIGWMLQAAWALALVLGMLGAWRLDADPRGYLYVFAATQVGVHAMQVAVLSARGLLRGRRIAAHELVGAAISFFAFGVVFVANAQLEDGSLLMRTAATAGLSVAIVVILLVALPRVEAGRALDRRGLWPRIARRVA